MAAESYIDRVRTPSKERQDRIGEVIDLLRQIIRTHAHFNTDSDSSLELPVVHWDADRPTETARIDLYDPEGESIGPHDNWMSHSLADAVYSAELLLQDGDGPSRTVVTIDMDPPNILGYDGAPLPTGEIGDIVPDLERYEAALNQRAG